MKLAKKKQENLHMSKKNCTFAAVFERLKKGQYMIATQSLTQPTINVVDAIWSLVQCQTKSVQRALTQRFIALDAARRSASKVETITPELQVRLDASRKDIHEGKGTIVRSKNELQSFLAAL